MDFKIIMALLIMSILVVTFAIPTISNAITNSSIYGTITNEIFSGTVGTAHSSSYGAIKSISTFYQAKNASNENTTSTYINPTGTMKITLSHTPVYLTNFSLNITANASDGANATIASCSTTLTNMVNGTNNFAGVPGSCLAGNSITLAFVSNGTGNITVTNASADYQYFISSANYTLSASGQVTPLISDAFMMSYTYGAYQPIVDNLLLIIPIMFAIILFLFIANALIEMF
jgi:hypothetical protein